MVPFAHLHVHSEYSLLDGACRIEKLVDRVAELGQTSCALTDHGVMYGVVDFYRRIRALTAATSTASGTRISSCCART